MMFNPQKRLNLVLRVATDRGDLEAIQMALGALRQLRQRPARGKSRARRHAA